MLFLLFAGMLASESSAKLMRWCLALASILAITNLAYLAINILPQNEAMGRYRLIADGIPVGSKVLPVDARLHDGYYRPFLHAGSYATSDSAVITPYLFAADRNPPMPYFSYVKRDYAPRERWYANPATFGERQEAPSWSEIGKVYQYLLVTVPWDQSRIPLKSTVIKRNDIVAFAKGRSVNP